jgi:hypothetical protein
MIIHSPIISGSLTFATGATFTAPSTTVYSGSFSGSFVGDGSQLSGVTSYTDSDTLAYLNSKGVISSSAQLDVDFLNTNGDGVISSSAQLTNEFDSRYLNHNGDGVVSGSSQITDGSGIVSGSVLRTLHSTGVLSSSVEVFDSYSSSIDSRLNTLEGETHENPLTFSDTSTINFTRATDSITADVIGGIVSSSAQISGYNTFLEFNGHSVISSSAQLTTEFDDRYINKHGDNVVSGSSQIDGTSISNNSLTIAGTTVALGDTITFDTIAAGTNVVSSSIQLTGDFDTRYINTNGDGVVSSSAQIDSLGFLQVNGDNVVSSSGQIDINSTSGFLTSLGTVTIGNVDDILPTGVISGSSQVNADSITNFDANVLAYNNSLGVVSGSSQIDLSGVTGDTDDVTEGSTNLYYTDARLKTKLTAEVVLSGSASQVLSLLIV